MYCPKCNRHHRKKYSNIRLCACGYSLVFRHDEVIKDRLMLFLERKASQNETRYFTIDMLYAVYQKHHNKHFPSFFGVAKKTILSQESLTKSHQRWQKHFT